MLTSLPRLVGMPRIPRVRNIQLGQCMRVLVFRYQLVAAEFFQSFDVLLRLLTCRTGSAELCSNQGIVKPDQDISLTGFIAYIQR
jgi:hypothetical protein